LNSSHSKSNIQVVLVNGKTFKADSGRAGPEALLTYRHKTTDTIPLAQVDKIQARHFSGGKTAALVVPVLLLIGAMVAAGTALCHSSWGGQCNQY
jgi:hypothetical protein